MWFSSANIVAVKSIKARCWIWLQEIDSQQVFKWSTNISGNISGNVICKYVPLCPHVFVAFSLLYISKKFIMLNNRQGSVKMVLSTYEKQRILFFHESGLSPSQILSALMAENIVTTRQTIARFIKRFSATGAIFRKEGSGRPSKINQSSTATCRAKNERGWRDYCCSTTYSPYCMWHINKVIYLTAIHLSDGPIGVPNTVN